MKEKVFKTLDEQIQILENKELKIDDVNYAKSVILRENYFFLMGYRHLFMRKDNKSRFIDDAEFREVYSLFYFDRQLRNILFKNILIIENNAKSIFSYVLSQKHGYKEKDYLKPSSYNQSPERIKQVKDLLKKMQRQINVNGRQHEATKHYLDNYGYIPQFSIYTNMTDNNTNKTYFAKILTINRYSGLNGYWQWYDPLWERTVIYIGYDNNDNVIGITLSTRSSSNEFAQLCGNIAFGDISIGDLYIYIDNKRAKYEEVPEK